MDTERALPILIASGLAVFLLPLALWLVVEMVIPTKPPEPERAPGFELTLPAGAAAAAVLLVNADGSCRTDRTLAGAIDWDHGMPYTRVDLVATPCPQPSE